MRAVDIIAKKRDGEALSAEEIRYFVEGLTHDTIPDYQVAAWAMAVLLRGMTPQETIALTMAMVRSGEVLDLSRVGPRVVDKHSTGGVGDKTTLVVAPLVAAAGLPVAKMSGRGLGYSGGTLDKLESIPGYRVSLSLEEFFQTVERCGVVVAGQTAELAPADGKLYALRDVTGTVPSLPLIASSIMSKKIAAGAQALVLDVKVGRGAFMATIEDARALAEMMIRIGEGVGRRVTAVLSDMSQPLGRAVGNALEVREAIDTLRGTGPDDLAEHCLVIASEMLVLGGLAETAAEARERLSGVLAGGQAFAKFREWIAAQGGDLSVIDDPASLPRAPCLRVMRSPRTGYLERLDAREVGLTAVDLGAGRQRKGEAIDHAVGVVLGPKVGDLIREGEELCAVHARDESSAQAAEGRLLRAYAWSELPVLPPPLIHDILRGSQGTVRQSHWG
ncbi:MAG: pyrimidine-nucleoside phosphorylase [Chloroflexi bacterium]|nr:pyrimidine-nucleoside phosphorylase [Chloroflexota bacterium]